MISDTSLAAPRLIKRGFFLGVWGSSNSPVLSKMMLSISLQVLASLTLTSASTASLKSCPSDIPASCQNKTAVDNTCCFNSPSGAFMQTQFWDTDPSTGPSDSWTIHGLWYSPSHINPTLPHGLTNLTKQARQLRRQLRFQLRLVARVQQHQRDSQGAGPHRSAKLHEAVLGGH